MTALICPHQPSCPGCPRLALGGLPAEAMARLTALAERAGIAPPQAHVSPPTGFRYRARLAIRGREGAPKLGIFEAGSHRAVHIPRCLVHHPVINRVAAVVRNTLASHRVPTYSDAAHVGLARYLQVVVERGSERAQVTFISNGSSPDALLPFFADLRDALGADLQGLWWNGNPERTNTILGPHWRHLHGEPHVVDHSGDARIFYPPAAFGQSNLELAMQLAASVRELANPGERVTELYCGVGAIGMGLAGSAAALHFNELGEGSLAGLRRGVDLLPLDQRSTVVIHPGPAGAHAGLIAKSDFVIADPPRKGLDPELLRALVAAPPRRFAYVSCDIDSFERDARELSTALGLRSLAAYDLFPHTEHLETVAVFEPAATR
jgi:23S rRNA (uracil1939-C5)-methyltransferase